MRKFILAAILAMVTQTSAALAANNPPAESLRAADFLLGTWTCTHQEGDITGTYTTHYEKALSDAWIKETYDFAATSAEPAMQGEWFIGYDPRVNEWIRFGAMSDGLYFAMVGTHANDTWSWTYALPGKANPGKTVYTKLSPTQYTIVGPSYPINGTMVTEHHVCNKSS